MLAVTRPSTLVATTSQPVAVAPEIRAVSFTTATIRTGRVAVAKIDCTGVRPQDVRCEPSRPGFTVEVLPRRARQGRVVLIAIRIHRQLGTPRGLCLLRFTAGTASAQASITVLA